ncbi:MAG TPA: hypothetical protein VM681_00725 [Candidatus Thermoplasmatota archaeon]|nr:hypothetical protein [Candidatus Thermoplasmatota archaeon]
MAARRSDRTPVEPSDPSASYNVRKEFGGRAYTGMRVGGVHNWMYGEGAWKERKVTPDKWSIHYAATKRRRGKAPTGSGAPVGTEYHWYVLAHQRVKKLDANTYETEMEGVKYKLAHKRAAATAWSTWSAAFQSASQRRKLIAILEEEIASLKAMAEAAGEKAEGAVPRARRARKRPAARTRRPTVQGDGRQRRLA